MPIAIAALIRPTPDDITAKRTNDKYSNAECNFRHTELDPVSPPARAKSERSDILLIEEAGAPY
jgi:hypothetical protein